VRCSRSYDEDEPGFVRLGTLDVRVGRLVAKLSKLEAVNRGEKW
jgi:hypothetical protein